MEKLKEITLDGWVKCGEGGNAESFNNVNDDNVILKLSKKDKNSIRDIYKEMELTEKIMELKIKTPKMYEKVIVGDRPGAIFEKIKNKKSLGRLCYDNPEKISFYAKEFARESAYLHSIDCNTTGFRDYRNYYLDMIRVDKRDKYLAPKMDEIINTYIQDKRTCIHGDLTVGNILLADGKWYWIDFGRIGYGDPLFDLADFYFATNVLSMFKFVRDIFHMTKENLKELWDSFIEEYAKLTNQDLDTLIKKTKMVSIVYFYHIWAKGKHIPIISNIVHHNLRKYYKEMIKNA